MSNYKIKVNIEMVECDDSEQCGFVETKDCKFTKVVNEEEATSIDHCEKDLLEMMFPAARDAIASHLTRLSKKKTIEKGPIEKIIINDRWYTVDGEIGRFSFQTHSVLDKNEIHFNSAVDLFPKIGAREYYKTVGFKDISMIYGAIDLSFRKTAVLINRNRYQQDGDGTPYRTLQEATELEGTQILDFLKEKSNRIFDKHGFNSEGLYNGNGYIIDPQVSPAWIPTDQVIEQINELQSPFNDSDILKNPIGFETPENTVNITIDDVTPKRQKEKRPKEDRDKPHKRKYVHDTIVRIDFQGKTYTLCALGTHIALKYLIAFLLNNGIQNMRFQFFTDGHKVLNDAIFKAFGWKLDLGLILDWYHLTKKCKEQLSMALKGRDIRNEVLRDLMPLLWYGLTSKAVDLLNTLDENKIRNMNRLEKLITYLERNVDHIPCYAARKKMGLCNSSSIGEKMNDLIVSQRQKLKWNVLVERGIHSAGGLNRFETKW